MPARTPTALLIAGLTTALLTGCGSSGAGSSASSGTSATTARASGPASAAPSQAPGTDNAIAGSADPTTSAPPTTPATAAATSSAPAASFSGFVGTWDGHGRRLVVTAAGTVTVTFRTYVTCTSTVTTGCDRITGNAITDGGNVVGRITAVDNATTVRVTVLSSSDPGDFPVRPFTLGHDLGHHALATRSGAFAGVPFCGSGAPSGYCGA